MSPARLKRDNTRMGWVNPAHPRKESTRTKDELGRKDGLGENSDRR